MFCTYILCVCAYKSTLNIFGSIITGKQGFPCRSFTGGYSGILIPNKEHGSRGTFLPRME